MKHSNDIGELDVPPFFVQDVGQILIPSAGTGLVFVQSINATFRSDPNMASPLKRKHPTPSKPSSKPEQESQVVSSVDRRVTKRPSSLTPFQATHLLEHSFESIIHDVLLTVYQSEKEARIQSAIVDLELKAEIMQKDRETEDPIPYDQLDIETEAAVLREGNIRIKGNPFKKVKTLLCPNCRLPRLLYPRVGFNSRPVPDPTQQYCKNEPAIIIDKHDVHGQRKKGVKLKGQVKAKPKKKTDPSSPAPSDKSEPSTPSTNSAAIDSFEFKEIEVPAAKCPHRDPSTADHWKPVTQFATHLTGSCFLKRDRAAGREANAKISGTPKDSRASSPKPTINGTNLKRSRPLDEKENGEPNKKQKIEPLKKSKIVQPGWKVRETSGLKNEESFVHSEDEVEDTIQVDREKTGKKPLEGANTSNNKIKTNGVSIGEKSGKLSKKLSSNS